MKHASRASIHARNSPRAGRCGGGGLRLPEMPPLVGVPLYRFAITTFLGIIPGTVVLTSVGAGLGGVFERGETPDLGIFFEPQILLPILGLCALAALPLLLKALRGKKGL